MTAERPKLRIDMNNTLGRAVGIHVRAVYRDGEPFPLDRLIQVADEREGSIIYLGRDIGGSPTTMQVFGEVRVELPKDPPLEPWLLRALHRECVLRDLQRLGVMEPQFWERREDGPFTDRQRLEKAKGLIAELAMIIDAMLAEFA